MKKLLFSIAALTLTTGLFAQKKADEIAKFKFIWFNYSFRVKGQRP